MFLLIAFLEETFVRNIVIIQCIIYIMRDRGSTVVKVLCYKSEGRKVRSQLVSVDFSLT